MTDIANITNNPQPEYWYRVEGYPRLPSEHPFGGLSMQDHGNGHVEYYRVVKHTPCGVWIEYPYGDAQHTDPKHKKFVNRDTNKRFACPTIKEAWESFAARKKRQVKILKEQLERAENALEAAKKYIEDENFDYPKVYEVRDTFE